MIVPAQWPFPVSDSGFAPRPAPPAAPVAPVEDAPF